MISYFAYTIFVNKKDSIASKQNLTSNPVILEGLSPEENAFLYSKTINLSFGKGDIVFSSGDPAKYLYLIRRGEVKLVNYDADGREKIVSFFGEGELIWEGIFLQGSRLPFTGIASNDVELSAIPSNLIEQVLKEGQGAASLLAVLSKKLHDANERNMILSTSEPKAKIARLFVYCSTHSGSYSVKMKLEDIASTISLRPETVSRKLGELTRSGVLEKVGQSTYKIKDFDALLDISKS